MPIKTNGNMHGTPVDGPPIVMQQLSKIKGACTVSHYDYHIIMDHSLPLVVTEVVGESVVVRRDVLVSMIVEVDSVVTWVWGGAGVIFTVVVVVVPLMSSQMSPTMTASTGQHEEFPHFIAVVSVSLVQYPLPWAPLTMS